MNEPHLEDCELTVAEKIKAVSAKLGEKISLRRFIRYELGQPAVEAGDGTASSPVGDSTTGCVHGAVETYVHTGNRTGVMVEVSCESEETAGTEVFRDLVGDIALQLVASENVKYISMDEVPDSVRQYESEVEAAKEDLASKPEPVRSKIVAGRVDKVLKERVLLDQIFIRENNKTVQAVIAAHEKQLGEKIRVTRFVRYNLGEGLEKKTASFAEEVAQQMQGRA